MGFENLEIQNRLPRVQEYKIGFDRKVMSLKNQVLDFSSQYGSDSSISYTAHNIVGRS